MMESLSQYSPESPHPKQISFLTLRCMEALYGGAAGGGKSSSLLLAALQFVHVPGYAALILRTDLSRLKLAGGLIPRSQEWLHDKARWNGSDYTWTFPNGAKIQFGYLSNSQDKYRYGSSEYQCICFDELTEFSEEDYRFMFSRLRMKSSIESQGVFYRIRAASNPGGRGHEWVKSRFVTKQAEEDLKDNNLQDTYWVRGDVDKRAFVPAKVADNPSVNRVQYIKNLQHLSPVTRERLMNGDWTIMPTGLIKPTWLRYYGVSGNLIELYLSRSTHSSEEIIHTRDVIHQFDERDCLRFMTVDTAGGMKDLTDQSRGKNGSWTVAGVWDVKTINSIDAAESFKKGVEVGRGDKYLICRHVWRSKDGFTAVAAKLKELNAQWSPARIRVEDKTMGPDLCSLLRRHIPISLVSTGGRDKVARATGLLNMLEKGLVFLPIHNSTWRPVLESEWLSWQGIEGEVNDQVDMSAYAAIECGSGKSNTIALAVDPRQEVSVSQDPSRINPVGGGSSWFF